LFRLENTVSSQEKKNFIWTLAEFGNANALSEEQGDALLKITHDFRSAEWPDQTNVASRWSSMKETAKKLTTQSTPAAPYLLG
jgi:hypothetical protein